MSSLLRVLLCDDQALVRIKTRRILEQTQDIQVVGEAAGGLECVAMAIVLRPDLVLMDVSMPDLDGIEAARRIRTAVPGIKILAFSAELQPETVAQMLSAGACGYLVKEARPDELVQAIRTVMAGSSFLSANVQPKANR